MLRRMFAGLAAVAVAATVALSGAPAAHAEDWCDVDPPVKVTTPGGSTQTVHLTVSALGDTHRQALQRAAVSTDVKAVGGGTRVTITVTVPQDGTGAFPTRAVVSTQPFGRGTVLGSASGTAGGAMSVSYVIPVA